MQFKKTFGLLALSVVLSSAQAQNKDKAAPATLEVDPAATVIKWEGKKVTDAHNGKVPLKAGTIELKGDKLVGGKIEVNVDGLTAEDITDADSNKKFLGHMKSEDFFQTDKYPTATYVIRSVTPKTDKSGNTHVVSGDLTIKDQTKPLNFPAKIVSKEGHVSAVATVEVDRTKWNLKYGSGKLFKGLGDKAINDKFTLNFDLKTK